MGHLPSDPASADVMIQGERPLPSYSPALPCLPLLHLRDKALLNCCFSLALELETRSFYQDVSFPSPALSFSQDGLSLKCC